MYTKTINCGINNSSSFITREVRETYDSPLKYCRYGSCGVNKYTYDNHKYIDLISYTTCILSYDSTDAKIAVFAEPCNLSHTTAKHITAFLREYCPDIDYRFIRNCVYHGGEVVIYLANKVAIDNETGEVVLDF